MMLSLGDLAECSKQDIYNHFINDYKADFKTAKEIEDLYDILIAYESVGDYGCDSSSYFLLRNKQDNQLYEVGGSHCSCYGFEGQFEPTLVTLNYLKSDKFHFYTGGYDDFNKQNISSVKEYINEKL
jgi:hypothetical protein